jgi:hypothetical protein
MRPAHSRHRAVAGVLLAVLACAAVALPAGPARAAEGDESWGEGFGWPGVDDAIYAMTVYRGDLIVGGRITEAGGVTVSRIARWDGVSWQPLGTGLRRPDSFDEPFVTALAVYNDELIVAGSFSLAGGVFAANVARWDGTSWAALGTGLDQAVQSLAVSGGSLFAGGEFDFAGSTPVSHIARWDGAAWQPAGAGLDGVPWALVEFGGALVAAGDFTLAGGAAANHIARWDGASWRLLGSGTSGGLAGRVTSLAVFRGELVAGGQFSEAGGVAASGVAAWNGSSWRALGAGVDGFILALAVYGDRLVAGGNFGFAGGITVESLAQWDGTAWSALATRTGRTGGSTNQMVVFDLAVFDGNLVVAGDFDVAAEMPAVRIARWDGTGWYPLGWGLSDNYYISWVSGFAPLDDRLIVAGRLAHGQNWDLPSVDIRAWDGTSMDLVEWRVSAQVTPEVAALAVYQGELVAAGSFTSMGGVDASRIAAWNGAAWRPLGSGADAPVEALAVYDGDLVAGGTFTRIGGVAAPYVARWNGSAWSPLGDGVDNTVLGLARFGEDLIVMGLFTQAGGRPAARIARWNGVTWEPLGSGMNGRVKAAATYRGDLIAGGQFSQAGDGAAQNVARWNGASWSPLGFGTDDMVNVLAVLGDELFAGGYFTQAGDEPASCIARWDGGAWGPLGSGLDAPRSGGPTVFALQPIGDTLYVGGHFETAGGKPAHNITTWSGATLGPPPSRPTRLLLEANRPNPFGPATTFWFALPAAGSVRFTIHDLTGRTVATVLDGSRPAGRQSLAWDGRGSGGVLLESGIYFARLEAGGEARVRKVVLGR